MAPKEILFEDLMPSFEQTVILLIKDALNTHKWEEALLFCDKLEQKNTPSSEMLFLRGYARGKLCQYESAIDDLTRSIDSEPSAAAFLKRGDYLDEVGQTDAAISDYTACLKLQPTNVLAYHNRGFCYNRLHKFNEAIQDQTEAIRLKPDWVSAYFNRGAAYLNAGNSEAAIVDFNRVMELHPNFPPLIDVVRSLKKGV